MDGIADILKSHQSKKAPAYPWQDLALRVIQELNIPGFKRGAVFKVCKNLAPNLVERAMNDTKELCKTSSAWKYFFKLADQHLPAKETVDSKTKKDN
ncbi:hypothetical protein JXE04_00065 [Patescibacteria group bacterium]|nr:hypothetical protein [Patescibacteria group bacterium]